MNGNISIDGAEPSLMNQPTKEVARSNYSLPLDRRIALALGFATHTVGWDILKKMKIPDNWTILVNHSRNYYSKGSDAPNSLPLNNNSDGGDHDHYQNSHGLFELNLGFVPDDALYCFMHRRCKGSLCKSTDTRGRANDRGKIGATEPKEDRCKISY